MYDTAIHMILVLHYSCVLYQLYFLDHELEFFMPSFILFYSESNVVFRHKLLCVKYNESLICKRGPNLFFKYFFSGKSAKKILNLRGHPKGLK